MKIPLPTEKAIQQACINYLKYKGFYVQRMNSGSLPITSKGKTYRVNLSAKGTPDLMAFKNSQPMQLCGCITTILYFFEIKVPGKKPTPAQEYMMKKLESFGAKCFVTHSLEELQKVI